MRRTTVVPLWRLMRWAPTKEQHDAEVERRGRPLTQGPVRKRPARDKPKETSDG